MTEQPFKIIINQSVAILIDGNNIEMSLQSLVGNPSALVDFDKLIPKLLQNRGLSRLIYFREGVHISGKLADRLLNQFHGSVIPCHKSADIPLTIKATQIAQKVDTIIILSGDSDYVELVRHLRGEGVRVEIAAIRQTTARILIEEADHFTPITEEDCYILKSYNSQNSQKTPTKISPRSTPKTPASKSTEKAPSKTTPKSVSKGKSEQKKIEKKPPSKKTATKETPKRRTASPKNKVQKAPTEKAPAKKPTAKKPVRNNRSAVAKESPQKKAPTKKTPPRKSPEQKETPKNTSEKTDNRRRRPAPKRGGKGN